MNWYKQAKLDAEDVEMLKKYHEQMKKRKQEQNVEETVKEIERKSRPRIPQYKLPKEGFPTDYDKKDWGILALHPDYKPGQKQDPDFDNTPMYHGRKIPKKLPPREPGDDI